MTQAFNLAQFANKLNTSGQTDNTGLQNSSITVNTTSPITGGATTALGSSLTIAHANSGVTANTYTAATITVNAQGHITSASSNSVGAGTVTSVATGNGLQGGTITSTGTLSVACPAFNTVGSYCWGSYNGTQDGTQSSVVQGSNYSVGSTNGTVNAVTGFIYDNGDNYVGVSSKRTGLSGTWKWMTGSTSGGSINFIGGLICRVS